MRVSYYKSFIGVVIIAGIVVATNYVFKNSLPSLAHASLEVPGTLVQRTLGGIATYWKSFFRVAEIIRQNKDITDENYALKSAIAGLEGERRENEFLRLQLNAPRRGNDRLLLVDIVDVRRDLLSSTILINKGSAEGVVENMPVIGAGNVLAGRVREVFEHSASVMMVDDPRSTVQIRIGENILASIRGKGIKNKMTVDLVTNQDVIKEGDLFVTSGFDGLPSGLAAGKISVIDKGGTELFRGVEADMLFDPWSHTQAFIIMR